MDPSFGGFVKTILPKMPLMGKTALSHALGSSEQSKQWDLRTALIVNVLRSIVTGTPSPISKVQKLSLQGYEIKGKIWISKVTMPKPDEEDIRRALFKAIEGLNEPGEAAGAYKEPEVLPVEGEWTGYRAGATKQSAELKVSEGQKYTEMMKEVISPTTILYFHGGAYYLMDPASHRFTCQKLAKLTKGRCFSVRYRLAPQNPFPAALLDALVSYFNLLYPPEGSLHQAVLPENIVFAGDSAGGNLSLVLLQTLLEFRRQNLKIVWNGTEREVPLPAGVATCSPWTDITQSSPSCESNSAYDYLPARSIHPEGVQYPSCAIWPADPPRKNLYAEDSMLCHPLVSPITAKSWKGSPPLYIETGQELLTDEDKQVAFNAASQNVTVIYEEYEAMPHCFAMVLEGLPGGRKFFESWAAFITAVVTERLSEEGKEVKKLATKGTKIMAKSLEERDVDVLGLSWGSEKAVRDMMRERVEKMSGKQPDSLAKL